MQGRYIIRKNISFFIVVVMSLFIFTSCGFDSPKRSVEKFLNSIKAKKISEISGYLVNNKDSEEFRKVMESIINLDNLGNEFVKLNNLMLDKVLNFNYQILENKKEDKNATVSVKFKYFNLYDAYLKALNEFLTKSLDFENLDNVYSSEYIEGLLVKHINGLSMEEKVLDVNLIKENNWKILINTELLELLTANHVKMIDSINGSIPIE